MRPWTKTVRPAPRHVVNTTGQSWCYLAGVVSILLERCVLSYFWTSKFALDLHVLGILGLLFNLSSLGLASTHLFLLKLGMNHANMQSQSNKAKTERNWRNTYNNRKLMQINPKFQAYIIKNTHAYLHLSPCYPSHP